MPFAVYSIPLIVILFNKYLLRLYNNKKLLGTVYITNYFFIIQIKIVRTRLFIYTRYKNIYFMFDYIFKSMCSPIDFVNDIKLSHDTFLT